MRILKYSFTLEKKYGYNVSWNGEKTAFGGANAKHAESTSQFKCSKMTACWIELWIKNK